MGRSHKDVVVVVAHDATGNVITEDIVPRHSFAQSGSLLLNSAAVRRRDGVRMISIRVFDGRGERISKEMTYFASDGSSVEALHRRPDGTIIEDPV